MADSDQDSYDVSRVVIQPSYRSVPWKEAMESDAETMLRIALVSESNVCRSVLAEAILNNLLKESGLARMVKCESRATRDYNVGEGPDPAVLEAAEKLIIQIPDDFQAQIFDYEKDIVKFDFVLVMDKYTTADVLREISIYDTIQKETQYTSKVRRLGEFHPTMKHNDDPYGQDIDDPLYGNYGAETTRVEVEKAAKLIDEACLGLLKYLQQVEKQSGGDAKAFKQAMVSDIAEKDKIEWLVPPMLQPRNQRPDSAL